MKTGPREKQGCEPSYRSKAFRDKGLKEEKELALQRDQQKSLQKRRAAEAQALGQARVGPTGGRVHLQL